MASYSTEIKGGIKVQKRGSETEAHRNIKKQEGKDTRGYYGHDGSKEGQNVRQL